MKKPIIIVAVGVLVVGLFIGGGYLFLKGGGEDNEEGPAPTAIQSYPRLAEDELTVEFEPVSESKGVSINLTISDFPRGMESFEYEFTYVGEDRDGNMVPQGVIGSPTLASELKGGKYIKKIFLGSCSKNVCVSHAGVESVRVLIRINYEDGGVKVWEKEFEV